ncbi:hypothetical protein [Spirosoma arcticum]
MLFNNLLEEKENLLAPAFDQLFEMAKSNQAHNGDLLLVCTNGLYKPEVKNWTGLDIELSPYSIGPDSEGHSESLHKNFINTYIQAATSQISYETYLKDVEWSEERQEEIEKLTSHEEFSVQVEMLSYLKIWEADSFIKKFYQLVRLINSEPYDWHFKLSESGRDKLATGTRQEIIRKDVRNRFQYKIPVLYDAFQMAYKTQIRNSIAHSNYSFLQRNIHLNNYIEADEYAQLKNLPFDEWVDIFHTTIMIYILYSQLNNRINSYYVNLVNQNNGQVEVIINRKDPHVQQEIKRLEHVHEHYWNWHRE